MSKDKEFIMETIIKIGGYAVKTVETSEWMFDGIMVDGWGKTQLLTKTKKVPLRVLKTAIKKHLKSIGCNYASSHAKAQGNYLAMMRKGKKIHSNYKRSGVSCV
jgi:hypothetical protein